MAHVWLAMHGSSTIPEFYYLMCFFNLILKLCLHCKEIIPFLLFFVFDPVFLLFCYLFLLISWAIIFVQNSSRRRQEEYLEIYIADFEQLISDDIVWRMLEGISS